MVKASDMRRHYSPEEDRAIRVHGDTLRSKLGRKKGALESLGVKLLRSLNDAGLCKARTIGAVLSRHHKLRRDEKSELVGLNQKRREKTEEAQLGQLREALNGPEALKRGLKWLFDGLNEGRNVALGKRLIAAEEKLEDLAHARRKSNQLFERMVVAWES